VGLSDRLSCERLEHRAEGMTRWARIGIRVARLHSETFTGGIWLLPQLLIGPALGGRLWAAISAYLKTRQQTRAVLVSLMLNYVAALILSYLVKWAYAGSAGHELIRKRPS